jgi:hypothetical protein
MSTNMSISQQFVRPYVDDKLNGFAIYAAGLRITECANIDEYRGYQEAEDADVYAAADAAYVAFEEQSLQDGPGYSEGREFPR